MRQLQLVFGLSVALFLASSGTASAQRFVVKVRPSPVVVVRGVAPSATHIWVEDEWAWEPRRAEYVRVPGYWAVPPQRGHVWIPGHWKDTRRGSYWIAGHWRG